MAAFQRAPGSTPLVPEDDLLLSCGTTSSHNWGYTSPTFRLPRYAVPGPGTGLLVGMGLICFGYSVRGSRRLAVEDPFVTLREH